MAIICGVDGCRGGWIAVGMNTDSGRTSMQLEARLDDIVEGLWSPAIVAIDIPIGLPDAGPRQCDLAARKLLGPGRASSVFPAPIRSILDAADYEDACRRRFGIDGKKISRQTYALIPKIREVDQYVRANDPQQQRIREVHPEVCFATLSGTAMQHNKRKPQGQRERMEWLAPHYEDELDRALANRMRGVAADDIIDAFVALWTANRIFNDVAGTIPEYPPVDRFGLRMEMVA